MTKKEKQGEIRENKRGWFKCKGGGGERGYQSLNYSIIIQEQLCLSKLYANISCRGISSLVMEYKQFCSRRVTSNPASTTLR